MNTKRYLGILFAALILLPGCSSPKMYINKSANLQFIKRVAIMPFNNMSDDRYAGEKIKNAVTMELLERGIFEVAEDGEVNKVISQIFTEMGFREGELISLEIELIQKISEKLGVQALFMGTVESYGQSRGGGTPQSAVSISIRLVDSSSGKTTWRASYSQKGSNIWRTIFGIDQKDEIILSHDVVKQLFATLFG